MLLKRTAKHKVATYATYASFTGLRITEVFNARHKTMISQRLQLTWSHRRLSYALAPHASYKTKFTWIGAGVKIGTVYAPGNPKAATES